MENYDLVNGFLPVTEPLARLSEPFEEWERIADALPSLIKECKLREKVQELPFITVDETSLPTKQHWQRAYVVITYISQGYIWEGGEDDLSDTLPKQLAIPWIDVASFLGLPPSPCYAAVILWNWNLKNPNEPLSTDNFKTLLSFTGTEDEEWFNLIHIRIELAAAPGIKALYACIQAIKKDNVEEVTQCLNSLAECIPVLVTIMKEMRQKCSIDIFFNDFQHYFNDNPKGMKYDGSDSPDALKKYTGASGIQSSVIPLFTSFLGIKLQSESTPYLHKMRWHMPREHRQLLLEMDTTDLREYTMAHLSNKDLIAAYNHCIEGLVKFRQQHINLVTSYVIIPLRSQSGSSEPGSTIFPGSDIIGFLKKPRDETIAHKIKE